MFTKKFFTLHTFIPSMYTLHPWHGAHYGDKAPKTVNGLIEIPQGSRTKYEIDKTTGLLKLDRIIYSSFLLSARTLVMSFSNL